MCSVSASHCPALLARYVVGSGADNISALFERAAFVGDADPHRSGEIEDGKRSDVRLAEVYRAALIDERIAQLMPVFDVIYGKFLPLFTVFRHFNFIIIVSAECFRRLPCFD